MNLYRKLYLTLNKFLFTNTIIILARKKQPIPPIEEIEITGVAAEGKALCRYNDKVIFVPFAAPGDVVDLQIIRKKHSYAEARILNHSRIPER